MGNIYRDINLITVNELFVITAIIASAITEIIGFSTGKKLHKAT